MRAVLVDTQGPEIRTGNIEGGGKIALMQGSTIELTTNPVRPGDGTLLFRTLARCWCGVFRGRLGVGRRLDVSFLPFFCIELDPLCLRFLACRGFPGSQRFVVKSIQYEVQD